MHNETLRWDTLEHHHIEKPSDWYWSLGIISVTIAVVCIVIGNILFAIFVLAAALAMGLVVSHKPKLIHIELSTRGIRVEDTLYTYQSLESFWVEEHRDPPNIILQSKKYLMPYIVIPIGHISPDDVREYLLLHLKEVEHHESIGHKLLEHLGL
jgi:hypothetical protein